MVQKGGRALVSQHLAMPSIPTGPLVFVDSLGGVCMCLFLGMICARVDQLPLFPYNRGWETQPNSRGLYTHYKDSY